MSEEFLPFNESNICDLEKDENSPTKEPKTDANIQTRIARLLDMIQELRNNPKQTREHLCKHFGISRSQFYKDRETLEEIGFRIDYRKGTGFAILEDRLTPVTELSVSDRLTLMFALEHLSTCDNGHLAARALEVRRKLASGLESPFKEQVTACFEHKVINTAFSVCNDHLSILREAIVEGRRIKMLYERSEDWTIKWRELDPRRIYLKQRTLYLYAKTADETPAMFKVFRISRIKDIIPTGICIPINVFEDDGFEERQRNAFMAFIGTETQEIKIRFRGKAKRYIEERQWHESQTITPVQDDSIIFSVKVAEPQEVVRWARSFGDEAEVISVE